MTAIALDSATTSPPTPPSTPRVRFAPVRARQAVLDGGWWPRSTDPDVELPGLVHVLSERYGPIRQLMLNRDVWDARPRRLTVDARMVRLGWFASVDPALAIATTEHGDQLDLLVVPPETDVLTGARALRLAVRQGLPRSPQMVLAAARSTPIPQVPLLVGSRAG